MRYLLSLATLLTLTATVSAGNPLPHPRVSPPPVGFRFEPIPPVGNQLPYSYRAKYNRPRWIAGKIAYYISPTSQEAMSWHEHVHRGSYRNHDGRIEKMYLFTKPWEIFTVGPRDRAEPQPEPEPTPAATNGWQ